MSSTWKSLAAGFAAGVVSTAVAFWFGLVPGLVLWIASLGYIGYKRLDS